jgi:DNA-binding NtrC family response regulator
VTQKDKALVIDDDAVTLDLFEYELKAQGMDVVLAESGQRGLELIKSGNEFDVVLTDLNLPDINGIEMVRLSRELLPITEVIVVTGDDSTEKAVEAIRFGAFDYIVKGPDFGKLFAVVRNAVSRKRQAEINRRQADEIRELRGRLTSRTSYEGIIGSSRAMQNIYEIIENVAQSDANILILGESGTGKEVIANAIHYKSHRSSKPFVKVNCSALPKELIESQLFGHTKGSFTGASSDKIGFIGQANGGSLLLDEIGEMPIDLQPKLLRVLQEKVYYRVGSDKPQEADFRLISATNRDPFEAIKSGSLREDLYYRINTIEIRIPPLRERMEDVPALAEHFLEIYRKKYGREGLEFAQSAYDQMLGYSWRGNVRELQHAIERAVLLSRTEKIERVDIPTSSSEVSLSVAAQPVKQFQASAPSVDFNHLSDADKFLNEVCQAIVDKLKLPDDGEQVPDVFDLIEKYVVEAALKRTSGNKQQAANLLGVYRPRLYGMIKRHGIRFGNGDSEDNIS